MVLLQNKGRLPLIPFFTLTLNVHLTRAFRQESMFGGFESLFGEFGGGGSFGGMGGMQMGGDSRRSKEPKQVPKFKKSVPEHPPHEWSFLAGTEFFVRNLHIDNAKISTLRFDKKGKLTLGENPRSNICDEEDMCRWSGTVRKGESGDVIPETVHILLGKSAKLKLKVEDPDVITPSVQDAEILQSFNLKGKHIASGNNNGMTISASFDKVFDDKAFLYTACFYKLIHNELDHRSTENDIKTYKKKASKLLHPDKTKDPAAVAKLHYLNLASDTLLARDKALKARYDACGYAGVLEEVPKGKDEEKIITLSLENLFSGTEIEQTVSVQDICRGSERSDDPRCTRCPDFIRTRVVPHPRHNGAYIRMQERVDNKDFCKQVKKKLKVVIKPGTVDGEKIVFHNASDASGSEQLPGDIVFVVSEKKHRVYRREGNNLHVDKFEVGVDDAFLGVRKSLVKLDGEKLDIEIDGGKYGNVVQPGQVVKIEGEGMVTPEGERGDLYLTCEVKLPRKLSLTQKKRIAEAFGREEPESGRESRDVRSGRESL